jgi:transcriptional regulator GlxA family with amidase domain
MSPVYNVPSYIYPQGDILDFTGPLEIFSDGASMGKPRAFETTTFASQNPVKASALTLVPDVSLEELNANLANYDILVIPGAHPDTIVEMLEREDGKAIMSLIKKFATLPPRQETGHRIIQSVCSGALLLAAAGVLENRTVTTHHMCYDQCKEMADKAAGGESNTTVVSKRWVDAGKTDAGVRIVNAGGVTSGIDASLFIVELLVGKEYAGWVAEIIEFERRGQDDGWGSK